MAGIFVSTGGPTEVALPDDVGHWWLPSMKRSEAVFGRIRPGDDGLWALEVYGHLSGISFYERTDQSWEGTILGDVKVKERGSSRSVKVTLMPAYLDVQTPRPADQPGVPEVASERYAFTTAIVGGHCDAGADTLFDHFRLTTKHLHEWVPPIMPGHEGGFESPHVLSVALPDALEAEVPAGKVRLSWSDPSGWSIESGTYVEVVAHWEYEPDEPVRFEEANRAFVIPMLRFMGLCLGWPDGVARLRADSSPMGDDEQPDIASWCGGEVVHADWPEVRDPGGSLRYEKLLVGYDSLEPRFGAAIQRWFELVDAGKTEVALAFLGTDKAAMVLDDAYVMCVRALEQWHSATSD
jgi:hypothetical protein